MGTRKGNELYAIWKPEGLLGEMNNSRRGIGDGGEWAGRVRANYRDKYA